MTRNIFWITKFYLVSGIITYAIAVKPPGYIEKPKVHDDNPPKYEYGYAVANDDAGSQGHKETRIGDNTKGNYYVNLPSGQSQADVRYIADDWGYHPLVRYATKGEHSSVSGHFALGQSAVEALHQSGPNFNNDLMIENHSPSSISKNVDIVKNTEAVNSNNLNYEDKSVVINSEKNINLTFSEGGIDGISKLVDYTKDLVSNKDVYDINKAAEIIQNNIFQPTSTDDQQNAATIGQNQAVNIQSKTAVNSIFDQPIVVLDETTDNTVLTSSEPTPIEVNIGPYEQSISMQPIESSHKQINVQIINNNDQRQDDGQQSNFIDLTLTAEQEAPSRQFLKQFKNFKLSKTLGDDKNSLFTTTTNTVQTITTSGYLPDQLDATPRPISNSFLAPIQAGLRLSNADKHLDDCLNLSQDKSYEVTEQNFKNSDEKATFIDVQKTSNLKHLLINEEEIPAKIKNPNQVFGARFVPLERPSIGIRNHLEISTLSPIHTNSIIDTSNQIINKNIPYAEKVEKIGQKSKESNVEVEKQLIIPYTLQKIDRFQSALDQKAATNILEQKIPLQYFVQKPGPIEGVVEKIIDRPVPYPIHIPKIINRPIHVDRIVEKIIERPVEVEKIIEKEVQVPYPVREIIEKIIEKPVNIEKIVEKPVPYPVAIEKFIDRPYPVEKIVEKQIRIPYPVEKYIDRPVEVEKIIEKKIEVPVDKIVEKFINVPIHIPYEKIVDRPYPVEKIIEKFIDRPVAVEVQVPVPVHIPYAVHIPIHVPYAVEKETPYSISYGIPYGAPKPQHSIIKSTHIVHNERHPKLNQRPLNHLNLANQPQNQVAALSINSPIYHSTSQCDLPTKSTILHPVHITSNNIKGFSFSRGQSKPKPIYGLPDFGTKFNGKHYATYADSFGYKDDYLGPPPLKGNIWSYDNSFKQSPKLRKSFNFGKNLRWEYGFKPPMRPSVEIDEHGNPLNKDGNF